MTTRFCDRTDAGQQLAQQLNVYANRADVLVLALPRGGVPVAYEIACALNLALDICLVRKLGEPGNRESAVGAIAANGVRVLNHYALRYSGITQQELQKITEGERQELKRRQQVYRGNRPPVNVYDRIVILVDDGLATGATMRAAVMWVRSQQPRQLIIAVPIAAMGAYKQLKTQVDRIVCLSIPRNMYAIGLWYENFNQVTDEQVCTLLEQATGVSHLTSQS
ncbi:phosphoribosyltransferase [Leptolyngbya sp. Heron Island J]|uniref:phosphoribosyltransferase n=1 Tax=Leptolyngbya sp. Heron Island J TaxID=1385935 RepID=UPI0003B9CE31|nr:phosphoribosyltransferase [Leptolyngbya sp. Heron Island J]ESA34193.1 phosphoribosyltransferase [Leptolyngbya sp. Heron Island J]